MVFSYAADFSDLKKSASSDLIGKDWASELLQSSNFFLPKIRSYIRKCGSDFGSWFEPVSSRSSYLICWKKKKGDNFVYSYIYISLHNSRPVFYTAAFWILFCFALIRAICFLIVCSLFRGEEKFE